MELYKQIYENILNFSQDLVFVLHFNHSVVSQSLFVFGVLCAIILLNFKIKKLEKIQISDVDDVTSFNRLIDDEIGLLREEHERQKEVVRTNGSNNANQEKLFTNAPYSQAIHLAQRGYARDEIIALCSLTESEAELILALHTNTKAA